MILNLTQHSATPQQIKDGVIDLSESLKRIVSKTLTFDKLEDTSESEMVYRADTLLSLIRENYPTVTRVMIGGALYFMPVLSRTLKEADIEPLYSFTQRVAVDETFPDGSVGKKSIFAHIGFVKA